MGPVSSAESAKQTQSSDLEPSYFRAWALREDKHGSEDVSPFSSPSQRNVASEPNTSGRDRDTTRRNAGRSDLSDISPTTSVLRPQPGISRRSDPAANSNAHTSVEYSLEENPLGSIWHDPERGHSKAQNISDPSNEHGFGSTGTHPSLMRHKRYSSEHERQAPAQAAVQNTKPAVKWTREISGHLLEIRIGRKAFSKDGSTAMLSEISASRPRDGQMLSEGTEAEVKEGLYYRIRRRLGLKGASTGRNATLDLDDASSVNGAGQLPNQTSSLLDNVRKNSITWSGKSRNMDNSSIATVRSPPNSSSIQGLLTGKPPPNTPHPISCHVGSNEKDYFQAEMTSKSAPAVLPSEASRIHTPPLHTSENKGSPRGFFFDLHLPAHDCSNSQAIRPKLAAERRSRSSEATSDEDSSYFRVKVLNAEDEDERAFALQVPEHLPNSPLCPLHPKHPSPGKGICVLHGRPRDSTSLI
jgi:hypothetical protein